jgi:cold shock CspA family protein/ribosome-associated translation inhibitor RaiA
LLAVARVGESGSEEVVLQIPLEITAHHFTLDDVLESMIRERAESLEKFYPRLIRCHVTIEGPGNHHRTGGPYDVHIDLSVPGKELVVTRQTGEDVTLVLRDAFDAARRQLQDFARRQRGDTKSHDGRPPEGTISKLFADRGYGFIATSDGREVYFHRNSVLDPGFDGVKVGHRVRFAEEQGAQGPQASSVTVVEE